ncbi:MAG TPA: DUF6787 family protein [Chitinophagaceae bacterium]|nr:DUF6787 family protein [Chitinophagaceae bacterium]
MLKRLKAKWNVNGSQLLLILCVFAITGSCTAWLSRAITSWLGLTADSPLSVRLLLRISVLLFGYQVILLLVAIPFGQFRFFWNYEKKLFRRLLKWAGKYEQEASAGRKKSNALQ